MLEEKKGWRGKKRREEGWEVWASVSKRTWTVSRFREKKQKKEGKHSSEIAREQNTSISRDYIDFLNNKKKRRKEKERRKKEQEKEKGILGTHN